MEALAAAASIVGLVSLAIQLIDKLQNLATDQPADQMEEFTKDLKSSAAFLSDVGKLAGRAKNFSPSSQSGVLLNSLAVQLQDYTKELRDWLETGQFVLKSFAERKAPLKRLIGHKFRANNTIKERIAYYENKILTLVSIVGRELDIDNYIKLDEVDTKLDGVAQIFVDETWKIAGKLEKLSNSSNAALSQSHSTDKILEGVSFEVDSLTGEFRELKKVILDFVSSGSSQTQSSQSHDIKPRIHKHGDHKNGSDGRSQPESHESGSQREPELEPLLQATNTIVKATRALYPPLVSEYVSTIVAWQLLSRFYQAIRRDRRVSTDNESASGSETGNSPLVPKRLRKIQRQLLALRKFCVREGLSQAVEAAEMAFNINERTHKTWAESVEQRSGKNEQWTEYLAPALAAATSEEKHRDWAIRVNTWLFQTLEAYPEHVILHRTVCRAVGNRLSKTVRGEAGDALTPEQRLLQGLELNTSTDTPRLIKQLDWKNLILRYWFLDDTAVGVSFDKSQSSIPETEATWQPISDDHDDKVVPSGLLQHGGALPLSKGFSYAEAARGPRVDSAAGWAMLQMTNTVLKLEADDTYYRSINTCADGVSDGRALAAKRALTEYGGDSDDFMQFRR